MSTARAVVAVIGSLVIGGAAMAEEPWPPLGKEVSMIQLIANPDQYHGKVVFLGAYATVRLENDTLCMVREPASSRDCLWLQFDDGPWESTADMARFDRAKEKWQLLDGKRVLVRGTFNKDNTGHFGCCSGALEKITQVNTR